MSAFRGKAEQRGHREIVALAPERTSRCSRPGAEIKTFETASFA